MVIFWISRSVNDYRYNEMINENMNAYPHNLEMDVVCDGKTCDFLKWYHIDHLTKWAMASIAKLNFNYQRVRCQNDSDIFQLTYILQLKGYSSAIIPPLWRFPNDCIRFIWCVHPHEGYRSSMVIINPGGRAASTPQGTQEVLTSISLREANEANTATLVARLMSQTSQWANDGNTYGTRDHYRLAKHLTSHELGWSSKLVYSSWYTF